MTGDYTPDLMALLSADIIISTPEKWDGISRNWHSRSYVTKVQYLIRFYSFVFVSYWYLNIKIITWTFCSWMLSWPQSIVQTYIYRLGLWFWMRFIYLELIEDPYLRYAFVTECLLFSYPLHGPWFIDYIVISWLCLMLDFLVLGYCLKDEIHIFSDGEASSVCWPVNSISKCTVCVSLYLYFFLVLCAKC